VESTENAKIGKTTMTTTANVVVTAVAATACVAATAAEATECVVAWRWAVWTWVVMANAKVFVVQALTAE